MRLSVQIEFDKTLDLVTHKKVVIVGRSPKSDLVIAHDSISRQHCKIEKIDGQYNITDLGSSNGVLINEEKIPPNVRRVILPGSQLSLGGLQCEISDFVPPQEEGKVVSNSIDTRGEFTSTIRLARIDLHQPTPSLELEKKKKTSRPRNPVTADLQKEPVVEKRGTGKIIMIVIAVIVLAAAWHFGGK